MNKKSSIKRRMDHRTKSEFASDIKTYTGIEGFVMEKWVEEMCKTESTHAYDAGVGNDGEVIQGCVGVNADYRVVTVNAGGEEMECLVDVKHNYNDATATFKRHNLDAYIKNDIWMLVVLGTGLNGRSVKKEDYEEVWTKSVGRRVWDLVGPQDMEDIIKNVPCTKLKFMGNKPGHIIYRRQFETYFDFKEFKE